MQYIHVKNLEKYHPGYKDRNLQWCKAYFTMVNADPQFEMVPEVDKWRFLALVMLELQIKRPVPYDTNYLMRKGFNDKEHPISLSLQMLQNFIEVVTEEGNSCSVDKDAVTEKKESRNTKKQEPVTDEVWLAELKKDSIYSHINIDQEIGKMKRWLELRPARKFSRRFIINWLNKIERPIVQKKADVLKRCIVCSKDFPESKFWAHRTACEEKFYQENPRGPMASQVSSLIAGVAQNLSTEKGGKA
ncbi:MAG: hypothetical protein MOGMAGMI_01985 [Candidatus Omnitrophica bacterium]|nr:hypothetical protein [Candidatus Omnitrophota bacterium]